MPGTIECTPNGIITSVCQKNHSALYREWKDGWNVISKVKGAPFRKSEFENLLSLEQKFWISLNVTLIFYHSINNKIN